MRNGTWSATDPFRLRWHLGIFAALAVTLLSLLPQISFWRIRGDQWQGSFYSYHPDEYPYASYVNSLINGQPRRTDPYSGRHSDLPESILSIQFIPAYAIAIPARLTGTSASTAFILLTPISAFLSGLAIFCLVGYVTRDARVAAISVLLVLCLGSFARGQWLIGLFGGSPLPRIPFPFLRRYEPALAFPLFFFFCFLLWKMLTARRLSHVYLSLAAAGATFGLLVFSYYFLWTAAAAVLGSLVLVLAVSRPNGYWVALKRVGLLTAICGLTLIPYGVLLSRRHDTIDTHTALTLTHSPDFRPVTLFCITLVGFLIVAMRQKWIEPTWAWLFTLVLAVAPVAMLNQQVLTGRSLQPQHYELFVANYMLLVAASMTAGLLAHHRRYKMISKPLLLIVVSLFAISYGGVEASLASKVRANVTIDEFMPMASRLASVTKGPSETVLVIHPLVTLPDYLPSVARVSVLWAPHSFAFSGLSEGEIKERYFQHLYYSNVDQEQKARSSYAWGMFRQVVFGWGRVIPGLTEKWQPVTAEEEKEALSDYASYVATFNQERALHPQLSFVVTSNKVPADLSRVDLWYERDQGEQIGEFILYRVKPKIKN